MIQLLRVAQGSALLLFASFAAGCGIHETAPTALVDSGAGATINPAQALAAFAPSVDAANGHFLDLTPGGHAVSSRVFRYRITPTGATEPGPWNTIVATLDRTTDGLDTRFGVTYVVQTEAFTEDNGNTGSVVDLVRQDRSGVYLWQEDLARTAGTDARHAGIAQAIAGRGFDARTQAAFAGALARLEAKWAALGQPIALSELAAARAGARSAGVGPHEITLLRYPLRPGASWDGRVGFNRWTVEARERVVVPAGAFAAARIRIDVAQFGPNDRYVTWWSGPGMIANQAHFEANATDEAGNDYGILESEQQQQLTAWTPGTGS